MYLTALTSLKICKSAIGKTTCTLLMIIKSSAIKDTAAYLDTSVKLRESFQQSQATV